MQPRGLAPCSASMSPRRSCATITAGGLWGENHDTEKPQHRQIDSQTSVEAKQRKPAGLLLCLLASVVQNWVELNQNLTNWSCRHLAGREGPLADVTSMHYGKDPVFVSTLWTKSQHICLCCMDLDRYHKAIQQSNNQQALMFWVAHITSD